MIPRDKLIEKYGFENPFEPDPLLERALPFIKKGRHILDVGCGEGADSTFLVNQGFQVVAVDYEQKYLNRLRAFKKDQQLSGLSIIECDILDYHFHKNYYDGVNCLLVGCCMRRSQFETMLASIKQALKPQGIVTMSLRNYLDPEWEEYWPSTEMIEPNTFLKPDDCCKIRYFIEKERLRELFSDFDILYYFEGFIADKYQQIAQHGDSCIIARKKERIRAFTTV